MVNSADRDKALQDIKNLTWIDFNKRLDESEDLAKLPADRKKMLFKFIDSNYLVSPIDKFDIEQFLLKYLKNDAYDPNHNCIDFENFNYEYDPAKNGYNMVKHGLSFREVASLSPNFGALSVPLPEDKEKRFVVFSNLCIGLGGKLEMPPSNLKQISLITSIITNREDNLRPIKMRFISSRRISSKASKRRKDLENIFKNIVNDEKIRSSFIDNCFKIIRTSLITA